MELESVLLENLTSNEEFVRTALPYIYADYFPLEHHKTLFGIIDEYVAKYNRPPSKEALGIEIQNVSNLTQENFDSMMGVINAWEGSTVDHAWLVDTSEAWCQDRALFNALGASVQIAQASDEGKGLGRGEIPEMMIKALGVSFDSSIGLRYIADAETRYDSYHNSNKKYPTSISRLNHYMGGGFEEKTLNVIMGSTGTGKSIWLCQFAADFLLQGRNVLYITLELSEEKVAERIDANLMDVAVQNIKNLSKSKFTSLCDDLTKKTTGELVIREYPTGQAHTGHFRHLLNELRMKQDFVPDVICLDYINICASSRITKGGSGSYEYVKAIAEEVRGLGVEFHIPVWSATQSNRGAASSSTPGIDDVSESWGLPQTVDFLGVIITDDQMKESGQQMFKILKNRYGPSEKSFMVNINYEKMRVFDQDTYDGSQPDSDGVVPPPDIKPSPFDAPVAAPASSSVEGATRFDAFKY